MAAAFTPQRFTQQPTQPVQIDRNLPLAAGLVAALYPNMGTAKANGGASLLASRDGPGFTTSGTADYWLASSTALASTSSTWTILVIANGSTTNTSSGANLYCERPNDTQIVKLGISGGTSNNAAQLVVRDLSGNLIILTGNANVKTDSGSRRIIMATRRAANDHRLYVGGQLDNTATTNINGAFGASSATIGNDPFDTASTLSGASVALVLVWARALSDAEIAQVSRNPYMVLQPARRPAYAAFVATPNLPMSGAAAAVASAYGSLTTSIPLAGAGAATAAASGALTTAIALGGAATCNARASGTLTTGIALAGAAAAQASGSGVLSTGIALAGAAQAQASASGVLAGTATSLGGAARAEASGTGALTTGIRLAGGAAAVASGSGALTTRIALSGAAAAVATAYGTLSSAALAPAFDIAKISPARIVRFAGSGSRIVTFGGSGPRMRINAMYLKMPTEIDEKWTVDRDPDEESWYGAEITQELLDRNTTAKGVELVLLGVTQLATPTIQVTTIDGASRTFVGAFLGGIDGPVPDSWKWVARVRCANGERFDKTTHFNEVDP